MNDSIYVLLVDNEEAFWKPVKRRLSKEGFVVDVATSGEEALAKVQSSKGKFHIAVIDQVIGSVSGIEIVYQLRQLNPNIEAIILTGWKEMKPAKKAIELGAWYMDKTLNAENLALDIRSAVHFSQEHQKNLALETLVKAGARISSRKNEEDLYMQLYEEAQRLLPSLDVFLLSHFEGQSQEVTFPFCYRQGKRVKVSSRRKGNKITEYVIHSKEPLLLPKGDKEFREKHHLDLPDEGLGHNTSEIVVPMFSDGQIVGTINTLTYKPDINYTQEHVQILQAFANQAAMAIRNVQQMEEARQLREAAMVLAGKRGKEAVLQAIVQEAHRLISSEYTGLILQDEDGNLHKVKPVEPEDFYDRFDEPRQWGGVTREVVKTRQPRVIPNVDDDPLVKESVRAIGIRSMLAFPLIHADRVLGVLFAHTYSHRSFDLHDVHLWTAFATQAAATLSKTMEEERQIQDYLCLANELGTLNEKMDFSETMVRVATAGKAVFNSDTSRIAFVDPPTGKVLDWAWAQGDPEEYRYESEPRPEGLTYYVLRTKQPLFHRVGDLDGPQPIPELVAKGLKSFASLPLIYGGRVIGILHCNYLKQQRPFDEHLKTLMEAFCARAAIALARVRREKIFDAWRALDHLEVTYQDYDTLYRALMEKAHATLNASFSVFYPSSFVTSLGKTLPVEVECKYIGDPPMNWEFTDHGHRNELTQELEQVSDGLLIINDLDGPSRILYPSMTQLGGIKAFIAMRLNVTLQGWNHPQMAGLLILAYRERTTFETNDLAGLQSAGNQLVAGILRRNLQSVLQNAAEKRNQQFRSVIDIFEYYIRDNRGLSLDFIAEHSLGILGIDVCTILEYDQSRSRFLQRGAAGLRSPNAHYTIPDDKYKVRFINATEPIEIKNVQLDDLTRDSDFVRRENIQSVMIYPLRVEGEFLGLFFANSYELKEFSPVEKEAISLFADFTALVLHGSQLKAELSDTQHILDRHLFLVWVSMLENTWRHSIVLKASAIQNYTFILQKRLKQLPKIPLAMDDIPKHIMNIDKLASDIANAPPRVPQSVEMKAELIPLASLLIDVADKMPLLDTDPPIEILKEVEGLGSIQVSGYIRWLAYALEALLQNARNAMPTGGKVIISGVQKGKWAEIRIRDTGSGVPDAIRATLFKDVTSKEEDKKGMGIGGLLVATIVEDHRGIIELERPGPGDTTVLIRLPIVQDGK